MNVPQQLKDHALFGEFTTAELAGLVERGEMRSYRPGQRIIRAGDPGTFLGVVLEGTACAQRHDGRGETVTLGEIPCGAYFGEISLISGEATTADVVAVTPCQVLQFPHRVMTEALAGRPAAMSHIARTIASRLRPQAAEGPGVSPVAVAEDTAGLTTRDRILTVECTGSAIRYQYFDTDNEMGSFSGTVEGLGGEAAVHNSHGLRWEQSEAVPGDLGSAVEAIVRGVRERLGEEAQLTAVGHLVPHGGEVFAGPVTMDGDVAGRVAELGEGLCPADRPAAEALCAFAEALRGIPQIAVFDTAFFAAMPPATFLCGLPYESYEQQGIRHYGRQGLVHEQAAVLAAAHLQRPPAALNLVVCQIGPAPSVSAVAGGRGVDFELVFPEHEAAGAVGSEALAPGADPWADLPNLFELSQSGDEHAEAAVDVLTYRLRKLVGAAWVSLGKVDGLVFTGQWGSVLPLLRTRVCGKLAGLGVMLDEGRNADPHPDARGVSDLSHAGAVIPVLVTPTDQPRMIACQVAEVIGHSPVCAALLARRRPIPIGVSVRHLHLSRADLAALYGEGHELTFRAPLSQPGQFACEETVDLLGAKGRIGRVRVLGPERPETQVEISRTECFQLGIPAPIRMSGELAGTPGLQLEGPCGVIDLAQGAICARRHLHLSPEEALGLGLRQRDEISVRVGGERSLVFNDVAVRVHPDYRLDMHIDTDEANAARLDQGAVGYVESVDVRA